VGVEFMWFPPRNRLAGGLVLQRALSFLVCWDDIATVFVIFRVYAFQDISLSASSSLSGSFWVCLSGHCSDARDATGLR